MVELTSIYRDAAKRCHQMLHRVLGDPYGLHPPKGFKLRSIVHDGCYQVLRSEYPSLPTMMLSAAMEDATDNFTSTLGLLREGYYQAKFPREIRVGIGLIRSAFALDPSANRVGITTFANTDRTRKPFRIHCGKEPRTLLLKAIRQRDGCKLGEARLVKRQQDWFLDVAVQQQVPPTPWYNVPWGERTFIGVDQGVNDVATFLALLPNGVFHPPMTVPGGALKNKLVKLKGRRAAADRRKDVKAMKAIETQRRNAIRHYCHVAAARVVDYAKHFDNPVIVLENLETFLVEATRHSTETNYLLSNWGRGLLRDYVTYKSQLCGILLVSVDPYGSTRFCNRCGAWTRYEEGSGYRVLRCPRCGLSVGRDVNAAMNLALRGRYLRAVELLLFLAGCTSNPVQPQRVGGYSKSLVLQALNRRILFG